MTVPRIVLAALLLAAASHAQVPTPESVFGFAPCAERQLADYNQISDYFRRLDAASERMRLYEIGETAEGRTMLLTVIDSEENLRNLDRYQEIARKLALADVHRRRRGSGAREGGQSRRLDRLRSALDGTGPRADGAAHGLSCGHGRVRGK